MQADHTPIWVALILAVPGTLAAIVSWLSLRQSKRNAADVQAVSLAVDEGNAQVVELKKNTDGMQKDLLALNRAQGRSEGVIAGRESVATEKQAEVAEAERVEDRQAVIAADIRKNPDP